MNGMRFFDIKSLSLSLGGAPILRDVNFSLEKGKMLAIVGPNGAGKSSLLKCIGRLYKNFSGTVSLEGTPLSELSMKKIARRIAWVHQTGTDTLPFTVREFARMSRYPWHEGFALSTKEDEKIIENALVTAGVVSLAERQLNSLSGGERQRALVASALAQGTDILFLDEPTNFLDYRHQVETLELIERINQEQGMTVIIVTHDINLALHGADEILALKNGEVLWSGGRSSFLEKKMLSQIFDTSFEEFEKPGQEIPYLAPMGFVR